MAPTTSSAALATTAAMVSLSPSQAFVTPGSAADLVREGRRQSSAASSQGPRSAASSSDSPASSTGVLGLAVLGAAATAVALQRRPAAVPQAQRSSRQLVSLAAFESELGVQSPTGFWDPVGFCADGDAAAFRRRRTTELKHGRVAMLATIGYIVPESYRFPGYLSPSEGLTFEDMPHGLAAISKVPLLGIVQFVFFAGFIERSFYKEDPSRAPGDYANAGVLGYPDGSTIADPEEKARRLNSELANGRLAMTAILALFFQNGTVGDTGPDMWIPPAFVKPSLMQLPGLS
mmetsp:Transcript_97371/g.284427  ORF Transcript_97371/g.284427 Transcript_97371/m.284427 type:complete len:290 (-) Transcript_97371:141-1010(-)